MIGETNIREIVHEREIISGSISCNDVETSFFCLFDNVTNSLWFVKTLDFVNRLCLFITNILLVFSKQEVLFNLRKHAHIS